MGGFKKNSGSEKYFLCQEQLVLSKQEQCRRALV